MHKQGPEAEGSAANMWDFQRKPVCWEWREPGEGSVR